jgi:hypothetical protein
MRLATVGMVVALSFGSRAADAEATTGIGAGITGQTTKITSVQAGAAEAGLAVGDVITHVADVPVSTSSEVRKHTIGPSCTWVKITVKRGGKSLSKDVLRKPRPGACLCASRPDPDRKRVAPAEVKRQSKANVALMKREGKPLLAAYKRERDLVEVDAVGFPKYEAGDLHPTIPNDINLGSLCGSREDDEQAANAMVGLKCTPDGYTWHHHQDFARMQLVKSANHKQEQHHGGVSIWRRAFCTKGETTSSCRYDQKRKPPPKREPCPNP